MSNKEFTMQEVIDMLQDTDVNQHRNRKLYLPMKDTTYVHNGERISFPNAEEVDFLKINITYQIGGMNYWNYNTEKRGYFIGINKIQQIIRENYNGESFMMFGGAKILLHEANKYNKTRLRKLAPDSDTVFKLIHYVYKEEMDHTLVE